MPDEPTPDDAATKAAEKAAGEGQPADDVKKEAEKAAEKTAEQQGIPLTTDQIKAIGVASADAAVERWKALGVFDPVDAPAPAPAPASGDAAGDKKEEPAEPVTDQAPKKRTGAARWFGISDE